MAEVLFVPPNEITETTIMGGNVDIDKYVFCIADVQVTILEPLLGTELYDKMITDFTNPTTYAGLYDTLYQDYIKPIVKAESTAKYIEISSYIVANGGLFKHSPENSEVVDKDEAQFLAQKWSAYAQAHVIRFEKWICKNKASIPEYKLSQDEVNAQRDITLTGGWYFGIPNSVDEDDIIDYGNSIN